MRLAFLGSCVMISSTEVQTLGTSGVFHCPHGFSKNPWLVCP